MNIRVYNYNTMEKVKTFEAHSDYIRGLAVHPTLPYVISASDDMSVKMWDWEKGISSFRFRHQQFTLARLDELAGIRRSYSLCDASGVQPEGLQHLC